MTSFFMCIIQAATPLYIASHIVNVLNSVNVQTYFIYVCYIAIFFLAEHLNWGVKVWLQWKGHSGWTDFFSLFFFFLFGCCPKCGRLQTFIICDFRTLMTGACPSDHAQQNDHRFHFRHGPRICPADPARRNHQSISKSGKFKGHSFQVYCTEFCQQ